MKIIDMPFERQRGTYMCSEASMSMVLKFHGFDIEQENLTSCVNLESMNDCVDKYLKCTVKDNGVLDDIISEVDNNRPVMVRILPKWQDELHTIVVKGYDQDNIIVNDPAMGEGHVIPRSNFLDLWDGGYHRYMACSKT